MKKSMLSANHHQVTCWNENPFFSPTTVSMIGACSVTSLAGRGRGEWVAGERGRSSPYHKEHSELYAVNNYHWSPGMRKSPQRWVWGKTWGHAVFWDHRSGTSISFSPTGKATEQAPCLQPYWGAVTDKLERQWCTHLYEDSRSASSHDSQMDLWFLRQ